jgi:hypothetical protein
MSPKSSAKKGGSGYKYERSQDYEEMERAGNENRGRRGLVRSEVDRELEEKVKYRLK